MHFRSYSPVPHSNKQDVFAFLEWVEDNTERFWIEWTSVAGEGKKDRRNEDGLLVIGNRDELVLGVFDGVSPLANAQVKNGGYVATVHAIRGISQDFAKGERDLTVLLMKANEAIREISSQLRIDLEDYSQVIGCTATLAYFNLASQTIQYAHLGDSALLVKFREHNWTKVTSDKVNAFESRALRLAVAKSPDNPAKELQDTKSQTWQILRANREYQNAPDGNGYGVLNGSEDKYVRMYVEYSAQPILLSQIESILLCTDGAMLEYPGTEWEEYSQYLDANLSEHGTEGFLKRIRALEKADPMLRKYPRVKLHDDATLVWIRNKGAASNTVA